MFEQSLNNLMEILDTPNVNLWPKQSVSCSQGDHVSSLFIHSQCDEQLTYSHSPIPMFDSLHNQAERPENQVQSVRSHSTCQAHLQLRGQTQHGSVLPRFAVLLTAKSTAWRELCKSDRPESDSHRIPNEFLAFRLLHALTFHPHRPPSESGTETARPLGSTN